MNTRNTIGRGMIQAAHISENFRKGRYGFWIPSVQPMPLNIATSVPALPTAAAAQIDAFQGGPLAWEINQLTAQTLLPLIHATKGLELALDQVNNETVEYIPGGNRITNPAAFKTNSAAGLGGDIGWFYRFRLELTTANGIDQLFVGMRAVEAYQAVAGVVSILNGGATGYQSMFGVGIASAAASPADVSRIVATAAVSAVTDTLFNWASTVVLDLEVRSYGNKGYVFINGRELGQAINTDALGVAITSQPTQGMAGTPLVASTVYAPCILIRQDAVLSTVFCSQFEWGPLYELNRDPTARWQ